MDRATIAQAKLGCPDARVRLVDLAYRHALPRASRLCRFCPRYEHYAEDITQETVLDLLTWVADGTCPDEPAEVAASLDRAVWRHAGRVRPGRDRDGSHLPFDERLHPGDAGCGSEGAVEDNLDDLRRHLGAGDRRGLDEQMGGGGGPSAAARQRKRRLRERVVAVLSRIDLRRG